MYKPTINESNVTKMNKTLSELFAINLEENTIEVLLDDMRDALNKTKELHDIESAKRLQHITDRLRFAVSDLLVEHENQNKKNNQL